MSSAVSRFATRRSMNAMSSVRVSVHGPSVRVSTPFRLLAATARRFGFWAATVRLVLRFAAADLLRRAATGGRVAFARRWLGHRS